jgi:hypothetical protein
MMAVLVRCASGARLAVQQLPKLGVRRGLYPLVSPRLARICKLVRLS